MKNWQKDKYYLLKKNFDSHFRNGDKVHPEEHAFDTIDPEELSAMSLRVKRKSKYRSRENRKFQTKINLANKRALPTQN